MEKYLPALSQEDSFWIGQRIGGFLYGAVGPFLVYGVHCVLPSWVEIAWIWIDIFLRASGIDKVLYDWVFSETNRWIDRIIWAIWLIVLHPSIAVHS